VLDGLRLETLTTELPGAPVAVTHAGDGRLFVTLKEGLVVIWDGERILPEPFLDLRGKVGLRFEQGLLSTAFPPDYAEHGAFYVDLTNTDGDTVIARFRVSADPNRADPDSRVDVLVIPQPGPIHNGGQLQFGPDGYLYVGMGDGGGMFDPACAALRTDTLLGKMLRLDMDHLANAPPFFRIPPDNPFAGSADPEDPLDEVWASGFRNPWRFSFDRATGDLLIADVGQGQREEVSFQPADSPGGEIYGWKVMEGTVCQSDEGCPTPVPPCGDPAYTEPILEVAHDERGDCAIVGGYVYRGEAIPALDGVYLYGDFCSGILRAAQRPEGSDGTWASGELPVSVPTLTSFGEDVKGEIHLAILTGGLFRLTPPTTPPPPVEPGPCVEGTTTLCLTGGRFRVETRWRTPQGGTGLGMARPLTDDTGTFWFFNPENLEVVVKVIDACIDPFDRFWVFAGGLTNVEVTLTVTDTESSGPAAVREYRNPLRTPFTPIQDTDAFRTCP